MNPLMPMELITAAAPNKVTRDTLGPGAPTDPPCATCVYSWVCSGASSEAGSPDCSLAVCCTMFKQYIIPRPFEKRSVKNAN